MSATQKSGHDQAMAEATESNRVHARKLYDEAVHKRGEGNVRYAAYALGQAVLEDPMQRHYAKEFLATIDSPSLRRPSWGLGLLHWLRQSRAMRHAVRDAKWTTVLALATKLAALRPRDRAVLLALSQACVGLKCYDSAIVYLRYAHKLWPNDLSVNRHYGRLLGKVGKIDEAVACWQYVRSLKPKDEEALTEMSRLVTKNTLG